MAKEQANRLPDGGIVDRSRPLAFRFNGRKLRGFVGDTLASALLANGVLLVSRSFKLHRPRGLVSSGADEPNAIVQLGRGAKTVPNLKATQIELFDGLEARSTKGWPGVRFDLGAINDHFSRIFSAGFYYKTFMYPRSFWHLYESVIRKSAGFGVAPKETDPDYYEHLNVHCDVLVVGSGPAGLSAATVTARSGLRVILVEERAEFGGSLLAATADINGAPTSNWVHERIAELRAAENVTLLNKSTVFGYYDQNFLAIAERHCAETANNQWRERLWRVRARQVVLAQGAFERPLAFCNNDRPGVMLASAVSDYLNRYGVRPGKRGVVFTNNDSAYEVAADLQHAGVALSAIVDCRAEGAATIPDSIVDAGVPIMHGHLVTDVVGGKQIKSVRVARLDQSDNEIVENSASFDCDFVAMSGGWSPAIHLHSQSGGRNEWNDEWQCFVPGDSVQACVSAGAGNGKWSLADCLADGIDAGVTATRACGSEPAAFNLPRASDAPVNPLQALWRVPAVRHADECAKQFVDFQTDVSVADIRLAVREGFQNVEHVKRYTAMGFGTDQGKLGNINGMAILAECLGKSIPDVGTTTFRPAYTPVTFGTCAGIDVGELYDPVRKTAIHTCHDAAAAPMEVVGQWLRPWYFPQDGEDLQAAVARECLATRQSVGMMDASTLGKIDVQGRDAVEFLERIYTHDVGKMKVGRCAYGIVLGEDGMLMDDGVMARMGDNHFYLTTTTGGAASVLSWLELWAQTEWPELDVRMTSLTDSCSTIVVAGPDSRSVVEQAGCDIKLDAESFPFMSVRNAVLANIPVQLFRVSFSGELAFEVNVSSDYAQAMWEALRVAGENFSITPYGTETMHVLRAEKGFVIVGQDTDGSVAPTDLGMSWLLSGNKDFLGKRSLSRPDLLRDDRKQLVGLTSVDGSSVIAEGAQLVLDPDADKPVPMFGHVTSSYYSAVLGHPIALALLAAGRSRKGEEVVAVSSDGSVTRARVTSPVFYDAKGERQNA